MALFVRWKRGSRKQGKGPVEWEDNGGVVWDNAKLTIKATLYRDDKRGTYESKLLQLSVEKCSPTKKDETMGSVWVDLSQFANEDEPVISKALKRALTEGPFDGAILRITLSCRAMGAGQSDESDDAMSEAAPDQDEEEVDEEPEKFVPSHRRKPEPQGGEPSNNNQAASAAARALARIRQQERDNCTICCAAPATVACDDCKRSTCEACDAALHGSIAMNSHVRRRVAPPPRPLAAAAGASAAAARPRVKSKGMQAKIREVVSRSAATEAQAHQFLLQCACNVDDALALALAQCPGPAGDAGSAGGAAAAPAAPRMRFQEGTGGGGGRWRRRRG